jgi:hypothetical protein
VTYLSSSTDDDSRSGSELEESEALQGHAIKTDLADDPDDNAWNVTVMDVKGKSKTFKVNEKELLGGEFVIEQAYNDVTAEKKKGMIAKNKRMRQKEARIQEIKLGELAREKRKELEREEYNKLQQIILSGRTYEYSEFSEMLAKMRKPFSCTVQGRDVTVTEADAAIMMEKSALEEISKILVSNKRANANTDGRGPKRQRNNAACNTTRGATGFDAIHGAARRDHRENSALREKHVKDLRREKESTSKLLILIRDRKLECSEAYLAALGKARAAVQKRKQEREEKENAVRRQTGVAAVDTTAVNSPEEEEEGSNVQTSVAAEVIGDDDSDNEMCEESVQRAREDMIQVSVPEYWEVVEKSTTATMNLFLRLFLPTCRVLQKNKPIKWMTLQEKVIQPGALTKTQFDSRVEDLSRKLRTVNVKLAGLEPSTPTADEPDQTVTE